MRFDSMDKLFQKASNQTNAKIPTVVWKKMRAESLISYSIFQRFSGRFYKDPVKMATTRHMQRLQTWHEGMLCLKIP